MPPKTPDLDALLAHSGWVRTLARSLVSDSATADDVEQQAWLTALEHPPSHGGNLRSWWATVVRSAAGKGWREQGRRRAVEEDVAAMGDAEKSITPDDLAERMETFRRLATAVVQLPEPYAVTIYLRYFEDLSVREVAARTKVPVDTAQSRIGVGLKHLRSTLQEDLGIQWRLRCLVFAIPIVPSTWTLSSTAAVAAIAVSLTTLVLWAPWEKEESVLELASASPVRAMAAVESIEAEVQAPSKVERNNLESTQAFGAVYSPSAESGSLVTVVDGNGQKPIPGAEVIVIDMGILPMPEAQLLQFVEMGAESFLMAMGKRYRTNQHAQIRIPSPKGRLLLLGRTDFHYGFVHGEALTEKASQAKDILLSVDRVETIPVKVVDEEGFPVAGAWVNVRMEDADFRGGMLAARTNAQGLAWLKVLGGLIASSSMEDTYVQLNVLSPNRIMTPVDLRDLPQQPLVLVKPPTGRVELQLRTRSGTLLKGHFIAGLGFMTGDTKESVDDDGVLTRYQQGRAVFPYVALNQRLLGITMPPDYGFQAETIGLGPTRAGETVVLTLTPKVEFTFFTGRVLNTDGVLAKNLSLKLEIYQDFGDRIYVGLDRIQTDKDGRFRHPFQAGDDVVIHRTATVVMHKTKRKQRRIAEVSLPKDLPFGDVDLGDLVVDYPPLLVAGRVMTAQGKPVSSVKIKLQFEEETMHVLHDSTNQGGDGILSFPEMGMAPSWSRVDELETSTNENGHFEVLARHRGRKWRVQTQDYRYKQVAQEFDVGSQDIEICFEPTMIVRGRILVDREISNLGIHVSLLSPRRDKPGEFGGMSLFANSKGYYEFPGMEEGVYALRIQSIWLKEEFLYIEPQELHAKDGEFVFPDIDLRGRLHILRVTAVDEKGQLLRKARIGIPGQEYLAPFEFQPLILVSQEPSFDLEFASEGKRGVILRAVTENQKVVMAKGIPVTIVVDNIHILPSDWDLGVSIQAVLADESLPNRRLGSLDLNSKGLGKVQLSRPGTFHLRLSVYHARNNDSIHKRVSLTGEADSTAFVVQDHMDGQEIHVMIDEAKFAQAIEEAREYERSWNEQEQ